MKIQLSGISEGIHEYKFNVAAGELTLGDQFHSDLGVEVILDKTPTQVLLTSHIHAVGIFMCDRCVARFEMELSPSYTMLYVFEGVELDRLDPAEFQIISATENTLDITEDVRQTILLSVPLKLLCNERCKGLCPNCGRNLNEGSCSCKEDDVDERWEQLRQLRAN
jgi:uncharacterized protein